MKTLKRDCDRRLMQYMEMKRLIQKYYKRNSFSCPIVVALLDLNVDRLIWGVDILFPPDVLS